MKIEIGNAYSYFLLMLPKPTIYFIIIFPIYQIPIFIVIDFTQRSYLPRFNHIHQSISIIIC